jgi:hypothetical protein
LRPRISDLEIVNNTSRTLLHRNTSLHSQSNLTFLFRASRVLLFQSVVLISEPRRTSCDYETVDHTIKLHYHVIAFALWVLVAREEASIPTHLHDTLLESDILQGT